MTIDHSDIRWQTLTGFATTDHTNATIYVPRIQPLPDTTNFLENETINTPLVKRNIVDYQEYKSTKPPEPPLIVQCL